MKMDTENLEEKIIELENELEAINEGMIVLGQEIEQQVEEKKPVKEKIMPLITELNRK